MFSFLPLTNNSVTIRLSFLLKSMVIIKYNQHFFFLIVFFKVFIDIIQIIQAFIQYYSIKALELLKCFQLVLIHFLIIIWYFTSYGTLAYLQI